jgi:hypothetical protein
MQTQGASQRTGDKQRTAKSELADAQIVKQVFHFPLILLGLSHDQLAAEISDGAGPSAVVAPRAGIDPPLDLAQQSPHIRRR